jgi:HAE1 family hydrophobic/amphiphilic exporter-1
LNEIGRVFDSVQNDKIAARHNGTRGIMLGVQRQPGTNTIEIVDSIRRSCRLESQLRRDSAHHVLRPFDSIRNGVRDVQNRYCSHWGSLAVIFVFLRSVSAMIIPARPYRYRRGHVRGDVRVQL